MVLPSVSLHVLLVHLRGGPDALNSAGSAPLHLSSGHFCPEFIQQGYMGVGGNMLCVSPTALLCTAACAAVYIID
jgi:hypothetical protein